MNLPAAPDHRNNFNLIRLLAATQVMLVHALNHFDFTGPLVNALKVVPGVPTFFFISGYLISLSYQRMRPRGLRAFFRNRVLRIYPALWVCVLASVLAVFATGYFASHEVGLGRFLLWLGGQMTIVQFYNPPFLREFGVGALNGALWTVSVELQFYLLVPLLFLIFDRWPRAFALTFAASLALNLYARESLDWEQIEMKLLYVSFGPWIYMFMLGFCALHFERWAEAAKRVPYTVLLAAYLLSMHGIGSFTSNAQNAINPISFLLLSMLILKFGSARSPLPGGLGGFIQRSDFSYGLYLYHMPVINVLLFTGWFAGAMNVAAVIALTAAAAGLSWYLIERPALQHKR